MARQKGPRYYKSPFTRIGKHMPRSPLIALGVCTYGLLKLGCWYNSNYCTRANRVIRPQLYSTSRIN